MTTQNWQLADVHISAGKGANTSLLTSKDFPGGKVAWVGEHSCEAPFGPTNFDKDPPSSAPEPRAPVDTRARQIIQRRRRMGNRIFCGKLGEAIKNKYPSKAP